MATKVLILTSDAGFGHRRAAQAVEAALKEKHGDGVEVRIMNPLDDPKLPDLVKVIETAYDDVVLDDPTLYQLAYSATDAPVVAQLMQSVTTTVLNDTLTDYVARFQPDVILSTYPAYTQAIIRARTNTALRFPVDVIVTDLIGVHSLWFHQQADQTFVATDYVYRQALEHGLDERRVRLTGLPVDPAIARLEECDPRSLRQELGWDTEMMTALIVGSARTRQTASIARLLDRSGLPLQVVAVSGGDPETDAQLARMQWKGKVHTYGLVKNMAEMMRAADFIICKAGGLIVSEALASGLPLILYEALPGQEVGNVRYVVECGAGVWSPGSIGALTTVYAWLVGDRADFEKHREAAKRVGRPRAAYDVADHVMRQVELAG